MSFHEICDSAALLSADERAQLATYLLDSIDHGHHRVSDEEVDRRADELREDRSLGLTRKEFNEACGR